ncbi:MAG: hypothetical protein IPG33_11205 [Betaproteobacteria bacterium]|nr:hypothetical protein [Betaproteobacteria bacterium]
MAKQSHNQGRSSIAIAPAGEVHFRFLLGCVLTSMAAADATLARIEGPAAGVGATPGSTTGRMVGTTCRRHPACPRQGGWGRGYSWRRERPDGNIARIRRTPDFNLVRIEASRFTKTTPYYPNPFPCGGQDLEGQGRLCKHGPARQAQSGETWEARRGRIRERYGMVGTFFALKMELGGPYRASNLEGNWTGHIEDIPLVMPAPGGAQCRALLEHK